MAQHIKLSWIQNNAGFPEYEVYFSKQEEGESEYIAKIKGTGQFDIINFYKNFVEEGTYDVSVYEGSKENNLVILKTLLTVAPGGAGEPANTSEVPVPVERVVEYSDPDQYEMTNISRVINDNSVGFLLVSIKKQRGVYFRPVYTYTGDFNDFTHRYPNEDMVPVDTYGACDCGDLVYIEFSNRPITADIQFKDNRLYLRGGTPLYYYIKDIDTKATGASKEMFNTVSEQGETQNINF